MNVQTNNSIAFKGNIATFKNEEVPQKLLATLRQDLINLKRQTPKDLVTILHPTKEGLNLIPTRNSVGAGTVGNIVLGAAKKGISEYTGQFKAPNGKFA